MKRLSATAILLGITISTLHTQHTTLPYDSIPKTIATAAGDRLRIQATGDHKVQGGRTALEEPAGVLNQAGNLILPALKMFQ